MKLENIDIKEKYRNNQWNCLNYGSGNGLRTIYGYKYHYIKKHAEAIQIIIEDITHYEN